MLRKNKYYQFTTDEIIPEGWLRRQLEIQAAGLSGNLDKIWRDVRDSRWIGGDCDGWERVPYWLDGFIPLAYLLKDGDMISRAKRYMDAIIAAQRSDGWICPCEDKDRPRYDMWACFLICKVLVVYYECSKDPRVEDVLKKAQHGHGGRMMDYLVELTGDEIDKEGSWTKNISLEKKEKEEPVMDDPFNFL